MEIPEYVRRWFEETGRQGAASRPRVTKPCELCGLPMQEVYTTARYHPACRSKAWRLREKEKHRAHD